MNFPIDVAASLSPSVSLSFPLSLSLSLSHALSQHISGSCHCQQLHSDTYCYVSLRTHRYLLLCASSNTAFLRLPDAASHGNGFLLQRLQMHRSGHSAVRP